MHLLDDLFGADSEAIVEIAMRALRVGPESYRPGSDQPQVHSRESEVGKTIESADSGRTPRRALHLIIVRRSTGQRFTLNLGRKGETKALTRSAVIGSGARLWCVRNGPTGISDG